MLDYRASLILVGVLGLGLGTPRDASAIITRHDVPDASYVVSDDDYPALVDLFGPGDCIGTLISSRHLLTVAHCAEELTTSSSLQVDGAAVGVEAVVLHPDYDGENHDIAVVRLAEEVEGATPHALFEGSDEEGATLVLVGRGIHATATEGEPGGSTDGLLRRATNVVASTSDLWIEVLFEDPAGTAAITDLEGVGAAGDSGGPAFLETADGLVIAGLNSFGVPPPGGEIGHYGASDFSTRVSRYVDWIESAYDAPGEDDAGCGCSTAAPPRGRLALFPGLAFALARRRSAK